MTDATIRRSVATDLLLIESTVNDEIVCIVAEKDRSANNSECSIDSMLTIHSVNES